MTNRRSDIPVGEFEAVNDQIEWYFGPLVEEVAAITPVSRAKLLETLVKLQVAAHRRRSLLMEAGDVEHRTDEEVVVWLPAHLLQILVDAHDISELEAAAAREVLRQLATAIAGCAHDPRPNTAPFVLLENAYR